MSLAPALTLLERLVAFDTTSRGSNLALIAWVEAFLQARAIPHWRIASPSGDKANLLALIGPPVAGGVALVGHTDVVPVDGQIWRTDPWRLTVQDGYAFGRGAVDMKGFIALVLALLDEASIANLKRPMLLALTYDEEIGCLGAPHLLAALPNLAPPPALAIIGEPTSMRVVSAHKGMRTFEVTVTGREAHSSLRGVGVSAIAQAANMMHALVRMDEELAQLAGPDRPFDPPGVTVSVGLVSGGTATNILARQCRFCWDLRAPRLQDADAVEDRFMCLAQDADATIKAIAPEGGVTVVRHANAPPLQCDMASEAEAFARAITGDNGLSGAAFVAEAGLFQQAGIPAVLCGPGSIAQAHQPNEWIALSQLQEGRLFLDRLVGRLCA